MLVLLALLAIFRIVDGVRYNQPYFLVMPAEADGERIMITTRQCLSGSFTNAPVHLKSFCLSGIWILSDQLCNEDANHYLVTGKESCFELEDPIEVRRFMPILQKIDDFEGYAFLVPNHYGYFIHLSADEITEVSPFPEPRNKFSIMEVNFGILNRFLNEFSEALDTNKTCYQTEPSAVIQVFDMVGEGSGNTIFKAYAEQDHCTTGYEKQGETYRTHIGTIKFLGGDDHDKHFNSSTFAHQYEDLYELSVPFPAVPVSGACSSESITHPKYNMTIINERSPIFPHMLPEKDAEDIVSDEIRETTRAYLDYSLFGGKIPKINLTEYKYVSTSTNIVAKYCCHPGMKAEHMKVIRLLFRMTATFYFQYYPYNEKPEPEQNERIMAALNECANRTDVTPPEAACITPNFTNTCPKMINNTNFNSSMYGFELPPEIEFEMGNLDYITEAIWKSQLFVHYFCSEFFSDPSDHSAFDARVAAFFNPLVMKKWIQPRGVHEVYELLLNGINLKMLAEALDSCVFTAHEISEYKRWLSRPADIAKRKKREAGGGHDTCAPANSPKLYCLDKQFDVFDKKLMNPFDQSSVKACYTVYQKRQSLKYLHSSAYGVPY